MYLKFIKNVYYLLKLSKYIYWQYLKLKNPESQIDLCNLHKK